jgi:integrase
MEHLRKIGDRPIHGNDRQAVSAWVMELQILTAARPGEAANALWSEIRLDDRLWVIPGYRMKEKRPHEVPLSEAAIAVLKKAETQRKNDFVFPGRGLKRINKVGPRELLHKMGISTRTAYRSRCTASAVPWGNTATKYDWQLIELTLAHGLCCINGSRIESGSLRGAD